MARGNLAAITKFDFIFAFIVAKKGLAHFHGLTIALQKHAADVCSAYSKVSAVADALENIRQRHEVVHHEWFEEAKEMAATCDSEPALPHACHQGTNTAESAEEYFHCTVFVPFLDNIIGHITTRFMPLKGIVTASLALIPSAIQSSTTPADDLAASIQEQYSGDLPGTADEIQAEVLQWVMMWRKDDVANPPDSAQAALHSPEVLSSALFPNVLTMLKLVATIPVVTCECERSVSALRRLKTYLRNSIGQERLSLLAMMHTHYSHDVDLDKVIDQFEARHPRRIAL